MLSIDCVGDFSPAQVTTAWAPTTRRSEPAVDAAIETAWAAAAARLGERLFDGPMCRLERWRAGGGRLLLDLSPSSYRVFLGTNMSNPQFARQFGPQVMANPLGVSPILLTADNWLLLGRRNESVAYYPGRIHPFAGCLEPGDGQGSSAPDVFAAARRELDEELGLREADLADIRCVGLVQDQKLLQSELMFFVRLTRARAAVEAQLDAEEHRGVFAVPASASAVEPIVAARGVMPGEPALTPVAVATLLMWGLRTLGQAWFDRVAASVIF